jgi:hypothetical protein
VLAAALAALVGCSPGHRPLVTDADNPVADAAPLGFCESQGRPPTTISGVVHAPNGVLPLYGVSVYVPSVDPPPFEAGVQCGQCGDLPGAPIVTTLSDTTGHFSLVDAPAGVDVPLIITVGKWRRKIRLPSVAQCADNPVPPDLTSLPKNQSEGELPRIAVSTGSYDALECLVRKLGVSDSEFTPDSGPGRVHLYSGNGANSIMNNSTPLAASTSLWGDLGKLKDYDLVLFSCEGGEYPNTKPQSAMNNVKTYADLGGRVFLSHYHHIWISGDSLDPSHAPPVWPSIATCGVEGKALGDDLIDQVSNPKGPAFAAWMTSVMGTTAAGGIPIMDQRNSCSAIDETKAERWSYVLDYNSVARPQMFQFTTPNEGPTDARCGKVVFSDMHVASGSASSPGYPFPTACSALEMTPQEKALAFMLFDIGACVPVIP